MSKLPFLTAVPPMATKIFLLASISREFMCQCPMVTPASLGGYACARAVPAIRLNISDKAAIRFVMGDLLLCWEFAANLSLRQDRRKPRRLQANPWHDMLDLSVLMRVRMGRKGLRIAIGLSAAFLASPALGATSAAP